MEKKTNDEIVGNINAFFKKCKVGCNIKSTVEAKQGVLTTWIFSNPGLTKILTK